MPTYDYQCRSCGVISEVAHSMSEDGPSECERCGGALRRLVHPTGIIFKGSGFYKTDSRPSTPGSAAGGSRPATQGSGDGGPTAGTPSDAGSSDKGTTSAPSGGEAGKGGAGSD